MLTAVDYGQCIRILNSQVKLHSFKNQAHWLPSGRNLNMQQDLYHGHTDT